MVESAPYIELLQDLIRLESLSGKEDRTADTIQKFFSEREISSDRLYNNVIVKNKSFSGSKPLLILNSHHDTVALGNGWIHDPLGGVIDDGKVYGRGSNDAGGPLVSLIACFCHYYSQELAFDLILIASGEEENFGDKGVQSVLSEFELSPSLAIIGEPTSLELAVAEKGLIVIDGHTEGVAGHAARDTGTNALYLATEDIEWIKQLDWPMTSEFLGRVKTTVTQIQSGSQHNVIPDKCSYVIDCRVNEHYSLEEVLNILNQGTNAELQPRSLKWRPNGINLDHPIVQCGKRLGLKCTGSPTLSDQVHFHCPSVKIGPGDSRRSHTVDEFIYIDELTEGIRMYKALLQDLIIQQEKPKS